MYSCSSVSGDMKRVVLCICLIFSTGVISAADDVFTATTEVEEVKTIFTVLADDNPLELPETLGEVTIQFTVNTPQSSLDQELEDAIQEHIDSIFEDDQCYIPKSEISFSGINAIAKLQFSCKLDDDKRKEMQVKLLKGIQENIGGITLTELRVPSSETGKLELIKDACSIYKCPDDMKCTLKDYRCNATCDENPKYCENGGTCQPADEFVNCSCAENYKGVRCGQIVNGLSEQQKVAVIAGCVLIGIILLVLLLVCITKCCNDHKKGSGGELFGVENVVAVQSVKDEKADGVAVQTDDSFLLNKTLANGVPPRTGYAHKIMQTNGSFLLDRAHAPRTAHSRPKAPVNGSAPTNGSGPTRAERPKDLEDTKTTKSSLENSPAETKVEISPSPPELEASPNEIAAPRKVVKV